jgi:hypothetical protein
MPQTVPLRCEGLRGANKSGEAKHLLCLRSPAVGRGYGGRAVLVVVLDSDLCGVLEY